MTIEHCHFGATEVEFLGRTIITQGVAPHNLKVRKMFSNEKSKFNNTSDLSTTTAFRDYQKNYSELHKNLFNAEKQIKITKTLLVNYEAINAASAEACGIAFKQPIKGQQYISKTDASFRASGYALKFEKQLQK